MNYACLLLARSAPRSLLLGARLECRQLCLRTRVHRCMCTRVVGCCCVFRANGGSMPAGILRNLGQRNRLEHVLVLHEVLHCEEGNALLFWVTDVHLDRHSLWPGKLSGCSALACLAYILADPWIDPRCCWLLMRPGLLRTLHRRAQSRMCALVYALCSCELAWTTRE